jgi:hypothetical protein
MTHVEPLHAMIEAGEVSEALGARIRRVTSLLTTLHGVPAGARPAIIHEREISSRGQFTDKFDAGRCVIELQSVVPEWVIVHEIAHWLDYEAIWAAWGEDDEIAVNGQTLPWFLVYGPASEHAGQLDEWRDAVEHSLLVGAYRQRMERTPWTQQLTRLHYLLRPAELFARSYTQWALGHDPQLAEQIPWQDDMLQGAGISLPGHWHVSDFRAARQGLESLWAALGLRIGSSLALAS